ncbi:MAG: NUDIX hydrolase [Tomitella sp.]|nr:NUDIX hydrolase [Tomitella sp.]
MEQSSVSVDVVALRFDNPEAGRLRFAAAPRRREPYTGRLALPGVLLHAGERLQNAARRGVGTKLGIPDDAIVDTGQLAVFDEPSRDPRGPTLSVAMWAVIGSADYVPTDDIDVHWLAFEDVGTLAFDHNRMVAHGQSILGEQLLWRHDAFTRAIMGPAFPATYAVAVTAALTGARPDAGNLNRTLKSLPGLARTDERMQVRATGRPSVVWKWE